MIAPFATDYGYQWWLGTFMPSNIEGFMAAGWGGQYIVVLPEVDMVVVITQGDYNWEHPMILMDYMNNFILPAAQQ